MKPKSTERIEKETLAKKLGIKKFWAMSDKTLSKRIEEAKVHPEEETGITDTPWEEPDQELRQYYGVDEPTKEVKVEVVKGTIKTEPPKPKEPEPPKSTKVKIDIEFDNGVLRRDGCEFAEIDNYVTNLLDKGLKIVSDNRIRIYSPYRIVKIDVTGLPS